MKQISLFLILFLLGDPARILAEEVPLTLRDCYALALKQSETLAIHQEKITEAEGRFVKALSAVLPHLSFSSSDKRQDGSGASAFTLREVPERKFVLNQTLFSGFKEMAVMASTRAERRQKIHEKVRAEQLLLLDVANAFYLLLEKRQELKSLRATRRALLLRKVELKERERLGRSRANEGVSVGSQLHRLEAEVEEVKAQEKVSRELLEFLTGRETLGEIIDTEPLLFSLSPQAAFLSKLSLRPDVHAAEEGVAIAEKQKTIAYGNFWPTVEVEGNYYVERAGASEGVDWDATLSVDVPLFEGGENWGVMKEAKARLRAAELLLTRTKRSAALDIEDTYARVEAAMRRTTLLKKAMESSEENYRLQVEDYRLSLVSNLDVLQSLEDFQDARRDFIHAAYEMKRLHWELRVAAGENL